MSMLPVASIWVGAAKAANRSEDGHLGAYEWPAVVRASPALVPLSPSTTRRLAGLAPILCLVLCKLNALALHSTTAWCRLAPGCMTGILPARSMGDGSVLKNGDLTGERDPVGSVFFTASVRLFFRKTDQRFSRELMPFLPISAHLLPQRRPGHAEQFRSILQAPVRCRESTFNMNAFGFVPRLRQRRERVP